MGLPPGSCTSKLDPPPRAWADLWDARLRGRITMLDDPPEVFGACLKKLGYSINSTDPGNSSARAPKAIAQKPLLRAYLNAEVRDQLVAAMSGRADVGHHGAAGHGCGAERRLRLSVGRLRRVSRYHRDPAREQPPELAHQFIDFLLRPRCRRRQRAGRADHHHQRRRPQNFAARLPRQSDALPGRRKSSRAANGP